MDYKKAYEILDSDANSGKIFSFILKGDNKSAIEYIKQITNCDDTVAKAILLDLGEGLITENTNKSNETNQSQNIPKCPTCGSTNIEKISIGKKAFGGAMFGIFSSDIRNTMHCKNCGAKW